MWNRSSMAWSFKLGKVKGSFFLCLELFSCWSPGWLAGDTVSALAVSYMTFVEDTFEPFAAPWEVTLFSKKSTWAVEYCWPGAVADPVVRVCACVSVYIFQYSGSLRFSLQNYFFGSSSEGRFGDFSPRMSDVKGLRCFWLR